MALSQAKLGAHGGCRNRLWLASSLRGAGCRAEGGPMTVRGFHTIHGRYRSTSRLCERRGRFSSQSTRGHGFERYRHV